MAPEDSLSSSSVASDYDRKAEEYDWRGPEVAFGLSYAFVSPGESVLDIGIGTGLSSVLFHKAGLRVYGMDVSPQMLEACSGKSRPATQRGLLRALVCPTNAAGNPRQQIEPGQSCRRS